MIKCSQADNIRRFVPSVHAEAVTKTQVVTESARRRLEREWL